MNLADYIVWRDTLGSTTNLAADGNGNNLIDGGDYTVWRGGFGQSAALVAAARSVPVPEPATILLVAAAAVMLKVRTRSAGEEA